MIAPALTVGAGPPGHRGHSIRRRAPSRSATSIVAARRASRRERPPRPRGTRHDGPRKPPPTPRPGRSSGAAGADGLSRPTANAQPGHAQPAEAERGRGTARGAWHREQREGTREPPPGSRHTATVRPYAVGEPPLSRRTPPDEAARVSVNPPCRRHPRSTEEATRKIPSAEAAAAGSRRRERHRSARGPARGK